MPACRKVLVVAPQPFFSDRGTPIATRHLLEALHELGYESDVLTYPIGSALDIPGVRLLRVSDPLRLQSVPIGFSLRKVWLDLFLFAELNRRLRTHRYLCVSAVEEAVFAAALAAPRLGVPVVYDMQSSIAEQMTRLAPFRNEIGRGMFERLEQWMFERVDLVMTSAGLAERVRTLDPRARVREWRYPGLSRIASTDDVQRLRQELTLNGAKSVVLYSGSFKEYQGLPQLLKAIPAVLQRAPDTVFLLVGAEGGAEDAQIRRLASGLPPQSLRILRRQPHEQIPRYLGLADVVVSPRCYGDNLPIKVLEYLAAGRAIVATAIPAHRTVLDSGRALLVAPTAEGLAGGLTTLLLDESRRRAIQQGARAYAEENLDWLGFVRSVGEMVKEVSGDASAP